MLDERTKVAAAEAAASDSGAAYAGWMAVGAVVAGSVGAIVGAAKCRNSRALRYGWGERPEGARLTAPHGDKLAGEY